MADTTQQATAHTPGPWYISERCYGDIALQDAYGWRLAYVNRTTNRVADGVGEANARLIAAAPYMLEALTVIADGITSEAAAIVAKAAIKKAGGQ